jgi:hypothetical protein
MVREQQESLYANEQEAAIKEQLTLDREREEYGKKIRDYTSANANRGRNKAEFLQSCKESFLTECIMKLYTKSMVTPMTKKDRVVARNLVSRFVQENGAGNLIESFSTKNLLLSEMARITTKYYDRVLEAVNPNDPLIGSGDAIDYKLDTTIKDDFYQELEDLDVSDASKLIKDRVSDAIQDFIDSNTAAKLEYEDIIQQAQDKIATATNEAVIDEYSMIAKRKINEMKQTRPKNVFNIMVESLTRKVLTDDKYKEHFMHEAKVDMDSVVDSTSLIYTMLEMVNTTRMVNADEKFINEYLKSIA